MPGFVGVTDVRRLGETDVGRREVKLDTFCAHVDVTAVGRHDHGKM